MSEQQPPPPEAGFFTTVRGWGITRSDDRVLSGVAGGLAERLGWSRGWTRVGFVGLAILLNGLVLLAYAAAWALLPDRQGRIIAQDFGRGVPNVGALVAIGIVALIGFASLGDGLPWGWGSPPSFIWDDGLGGGAVRAIAIALMITVPLLVIAGAIVLIVYLTRRGGGHGTPGAHAPAPRPDGGADDAAPVYAAPPAWAEERQRQRAAAAAAAGATTAESAAAQAFHAADQAVQTASAAAERAYAGATAATAGASQAPPAAAPAPASSPAAPLTPPPAAPRPPRVPGPGAPFYLLTLAWLVISAAAIVWAEWRDLLAVHPMLAWGPLFLTGLGVILMLVAVSGRRLGFLAFVSAVGLIPAAIIIGDADRFREGWADDYLPEVHIDGAGVWVTVDEATGEGWVETSTVEPTAIAEPFDALTAFDGDYATITLPSGCYAAEGTPEPSGESRGLLSLDGASAAQETLTAAFTTVRVPAGASLVIEPDQNGGSAAVHWPERGIACDLWDGTGIQLINPTSPTATLTAAPVDGYMTIVIEETEEVAP